MKFSLILVLLLGSCATSFKEDPLETSELSFLNGEYLHNIFGEETKNGHTAFFKNGVITYGDGRQINEIADLVLRHFSNIKIIYDPRDGLMPERGTLSIAKARSLLGYKPEYSIEKGFEGYIGWYKEFAKENPKLFS